MTGYLIKDEKGDIVESVKKPKDKVKEEHIPDIFKKLLKSNNQTEINPIAREFFLRRAREMLEYFQNLHSRVIPGSSILFIVDNVNSSYEMKIIDLSSCEDLNSLADRDYSYISAL